MVHIDWKRILSLDPQDLTDDEKEELYDVIILYDIESNISKEKSVGLLEIAQEILKFKGHQVEIVVAELDSLRTKDRHSQKYQELLEENKNLKHKLKRYQTSGMPAVERDDDGLREDLNKYEEQIRVLKSELRKTTKEGTYDKKEFEKLLEKISTLEREKLEMQRELSTLYIEIQEASELKQTINSSDEKQQEMSEMIRHKNEQISQLLEELEVMEKDNKALSMKVSSLRDKLHEATKHISEMTSEITGLKDICDERSDKLLSLEEQNIALQEQIKELVEQKLQRDNQLDNFSTALDFRVQEWKKLMELKDAEILELNEKLLYLNAQGTNNLIDTEINKTALLTNTVEKQEDQIEYLQKQLMQATKELNESAALIEQLKMDKDKLGQSSSISKTVKQLNSKLKLSEQRQKLLEESLKNAEQDSQKRAKQTTDMIIQLREYESGEFGLADALLEINNLKQQKNIRDLHVEQLVQSLNDMQSHCTLLEEENLAMREKLGISAEDDVDVSSVVVKKRLEEEKLQAIKNEIGKLEEQKLNLRIQNRQLNQQVLTVSEDCSNENEIQQYPGGGKISETQEMNIIKYKSKKENDADNSKWNSLLVEREKMLTNKIDNLIQENESLRKGMHEILDSIHNQDGNSEVELKSECLEQLLAILDARHISGWYHPAMRLQAQLNAVEGANAALRNQLRLLREEDIKSIQEIQVILLQAKDLLTKLEIKQDHETVEVQSSLPCSPVSRKDVIIKLNKNLQQILQVHEDQNEKLVKLSSVIEQLDIQYSTLHPQLSLTLLEHDAENVSQDEANFNINDSAGLVRIIKYLKDMKSELQQENILLHEELLTVKALAADEKTNLLFQKEILSQQVCLLQKSMEDYVPVSTLKTLSTLFNENTLIFKNKELEFESMVTDLENKLKKIENYNLKEKVYSRSSLNEMGNNECDKTSKNIETHGGNNTYLHDSENILALEKAVRLLKDLQEAENKLKTTLFNCVSYEDYEHLKKQLTEAESENMKVKAEELRLKSIQESSSKTILELENLIKTLKKKIEGLQDVILHLQCTTDEKALIANMKQEIMMIQMNKNSYEDSIHKLNNELIQEKNKAMKQQTLFMNQEESYMNDKIELELKYNLLQLTLHNLIGNDLKHIRNGTKTMTVALENVPVPAPRLLKHSTKHVDDSVVSETILANELKVKVLEEHCKSIESKWDEDKNIWKMTEEKLLGKLNETQENLVQAEIVIKQMQHIEEQLKAEYKPSEQKRDCQEIGIQMDNDSGNETEVEELKDHVKSLETRLQDQKCVGFSPIETHSLLCWKGTVETLNEIISQRDESIVRYQALLQAARDELSTTEHKLKSEIDDLHKSMTIHKQIHTRLKQKARMMLAHAKHSALESYGLGTQDLKIEISQLRSQLSSITEELKFWQLQAKKDDQPEKDDATSMKDTFIPVVENLIQRFEASQSDPALNSCLNLLHAQDSKQEILSKSVSELENDIKHLAEALCQDTFMPISKTATPISRSQTKDHQFERKSYRIRQLQQLHKIREEELKNNIKALEKELQKMKDDKGRESLEVEERKVKCARWDERKKWQGQIEKLQKLLKQKNERIEQIEKSITGLRYTITRLEREKNILIARLNRTKEQLTKTIEEKSKGALPE